MTCHWDFFQTGLGRAFWSAVGEVVKSNAAMDFLSATRSDPVFHFDSERVDGATAVLRQAWSQTLLSVRATQHQSARRSLGQLFHSLQVYQRPRRPWRRPRRTSRFFFLSI